MSKDKCNEHILLMDRVKNNTTDIKNLEKEVSILKDLIYDKIDRVKTLMYTTVITVGLNFMGIIIGVIYFTIKLK